MPKRHKIFAAAFLLLFVYAAGLTIGVGPSKVLKKFHQKLVRPITDEITGIKPHLEDYVERPCPVENYIGLGYFGQSNSSNTVEPKAKFPFPSNLVQYDWKSQKCFDYREPLLGANFTRGNTITYVASRLAKETDKTVVVIPFGYGPTRIMEWVYGTAAAQHRIVMERLKSSRLSPQVFLWHQGESDLALDGVTEANISEVPYFKRPDPGRDDGKYQIGENRRDYREALQTIAERTFEEFPNTRFGIALVSVAPCLGTTANWAPVRQAQQDVADLDPRVFVSADSDKFLGDHYRYDTCHFSAEGAQLLSDDYYESLVREGIYSELIQRD